MGRKCIFIFVILRGIKNTNSKDVLIVKMLPPSHYLLPTKFASNVVEGHIKNLKTEM
jgi:hypothetical protein